MIDTIVYLHGFLSSPKSNKARETQSWLAEHAPEIRFICPQLSSYPSEVKHQLDELIGTCVPENTALIGSSLGGFWSTYLVENYAVAKAALINPAVTPQSRFDEFVGRELRHYYTDEQVLLQREDLEHLHMMDAADISRPNAYWLLVQTADETLDYRLAVNKYRAAKQWVEEGGNHAFENYVQRLPAIFEFLTQPS